MGKALEAVAKGTYLTFGSRMTYVRSIGWSDQAGEIDVTDLDSAGKEYVDDEGDLDVTADVFGVPTIAKGDVANLSVNYPSGKSKGPIAAKCMGTDTKTEAGGVNITTLKFKRTPAS